MTTRHQPIRNLVDQQRAPDPYERHVKLAHQYLKGADTPVGLGSVDRQLAAALVHAVLALAAATADNHPTCGVHCHAIGC